MTVGSVILLIVICAIASVFLYQMLELETDINQFKKEYGVKPNDDECVTKGGMYCTHSGWCDAEIALFPEQYEYEMKLKNEQNKDQ